MTQLKETILKLKKSQNALILAHYYQPLEILEIADIVGDSFALAKAAQQSESEILIVCGVRFMAESAKILSPAKIVYLPNEGAGCPMADMIRPEDVLTLKREHPQAAVVCYVNSSAAVKAVSDVCCTSSSAERIVASRPQEQIIFVPDRNLGAYIAGRLTNKWFIFFNGYCPVHDGVSAQTLTELKQKYPGALALVHPECPREITDMADYVGSTAGILEYARSARAKELIIGTETGICDILRKELPDKNIVPLSDTMVCPDMKKTTLEDILACLEGKRAPIELAPEEIEGAARSLEAMVAVG
jgi:quinolinate synthase